MSVVHTAFTRYAVRQALGDEGFDLAQQFAVAASKGNVSGALNVAVTAAARITNTPA